MSADVNIDFARTARQGFPEVVYARDKTPAQVVAALQQLTLADGCAFATGVDAKCYQVIKESLNDADWNELSSTLRIGRMNTRPGRVGVVCAGTSDLPVAEEAARTVDFLGYDVARVTDVGVAGIHRLMSRLDDVRSADVVIVVAGMEGALPSVVGGLVHQPVIAVPTSVGYGTGLGGVAALMAMLNSCAAGVAVMNIDNGFGAAVMAARILGLKQR